MTRQNMNKALIAAVKQGDSTQMAQLLQQGAAPDTTLDRDGNTVLMLAAEKGHLTIVEQLVQRGASIDQRNTKEQQSALFFACWNGHQDIARYLIEQGADVHTSKQGNRTTLMYAAHSNSTGIVNLLLDKGVDINAANDVGLTALMYTDEDDTKLDAMRILLERGADINQTNSIGKTSLMRAVNLGSLGAAALLLEHGADPTLECDEGFDLLALAEGAERHAGKMKRLLLEHGLDFPVRYYGFKIKMDCTECGRPVVINGPMQKVKCGACQSLITLDSDVWESVVDAGDGLGGEITLLSHSGFGISYRNRRPRCHGCETTLNAADVPTGSTEPLRCGKCGMEHSCFPAPDWLSKFKHDSRRPRQVFCAEEHGLSSVDQSKMKPIAVRCISCGAVLSIDQETPRNATCDHCDTTQYLPDGLWMALHPVTKTQSWYLRYER